MICPSLMANRNRSVSLEKNQRIRNRQSKRFRPVLPSMEELGTDNPLYGYVICYNKQ